MQETSASAPTVAWLPLVTKLSRMSASVSYSLEPTATVRIREIGGDHQYCFQDDTTEICDPVVSSRGGGEGGHAGCTTAIDVECNEIDSATWVGKT